MKNKEESKNTGIQEKKKKKKTHSLSTAKAEYMKVYKFRYKVKESVQLHSGSLIGMAVNTDTKLACIYSADGFCYFVTPDMQVISRIQTSYNIVHLVLLKHHILICHKAETEYEIRTISIVTEQHQLIYKTEQSIIGLFPLSYIEQGFVVFDKTGTATLFIPSLNIWAEKERIMLNQGINSCNVKDDKLYWSSNEAIGMFDIQSGNHVSVSHDCPNIQTLIPVTIKQQEMVFVSSESKNVLFNMTEKHHVMSQKEDCLRFSHACLCTIPKTGTIRIQVVYHNEEKDCLVELPYQHGFASVYKKRNGIVKYRKNYWVDRFNYLYVHSQYYDDN